MFENEKLDSDLKFAVSSLLNKFDARWPDSSTLFDQNNQKERLSEISIWVNRLQKCTVAEINTVTDFCITNLKSRPGILVFNVYLKRLQEDSPLDATIVSNEENLAAHVIEIMGYDTLDSASRSKLRDAFLIAASVLYVDECDQMDLEDSTILTELPGRTRMFVSSAIEWREEAAQNKGFWNKFFNRQSIEDSTT